MQSLMRMLRDKRDRAVLSWIGGGAVIAAGGIWVAVTYFWPPPHPASEVCAGGGGIAVGGSVSGSTVTSHGGSGSADCKPAGKG